MKFAGIFKGKEEKEMEKKKRERELDELLRSTDVKLRVLYNNYKVILQRELIVAKGAKKKDIRNQDNYTKIGIAYYSLLLIRRAQEKMEEMKSYRSLYNCINGLNEALSTLNDLEHKMGKINIKKTLASVKKMAGSSGSSSKDLKKAYESMQEQEARMPGEEAKNTGVDDLVSVDIIEKLIDGMDVETCVREGKGVSADPDSVLNNFGDDRHGEENADDLDSLDRMKDLLDRMARG